MSKVIATVVVISLAVLAVIYKYVDYVRHPWTRDGQVRAQVIQVAPRVTGPVTDLAIIDNQSVQAGDLLFRIDQRTYRAALQEAESNLRLTQNEITSLTQEVSLKIAAIEQFEQQIEQALADVESAEANAYQIGRDLERVQKLVESGEVARVRLDDALAADRQAKAGVRSAQAVVTQSRAALLQSQADLAQARADLGETGEDNARLKAAQAELEQAKLNFEFTEVFAPVDGFVTNLKLRTGSQAVANQPALALVDRNSFWIDAYFRETLVGDISPEDPALVTLMSYPNERITGRVHSLGWGIAKQDGTTGEDLLPQISPTFQWIRLAQRIPVRVEIQDVPEHVELRVGTTASVLVKSGSEFAAWLPPLPTILQ